MVSWSVVLPASLCLDSVTCTGYGPHMSESDEQFTERLAKGWAEEVGKFDRTLLALATGALALSIPLVRDLTDPVNTRLVLWGWIFLLITTLRCIQLCTKSMGSSLA